MLKWLPLVFILAFLGYLSYTDGNTTKQRDISSSSGQNRTKLSRMIINDKVTQKRTIQSEDAFEVSKTEAEKLMNSLNYASWSKLEEMAYDAISVCEQKAFKEKIDISDQYLKCCKNGVPGACFKYYEGKYEYDKHPSNPYELADLTNSYIEDCKKGFFQACYALNAGDYTGGFDQEILYEFFDQSLEECENGSLYSCYLTLHANYHLPDEEYSQINKDLCDNIEGGDGFCASYVRSAQNLAKVDAAEVLKKSCDVESPKDTASCVGLLFNYADFVDINTIKRTIQNSCLNEKEGKDRICILSAYLSIKNKDIEGALISMRQACMIKEYYACEQYMSLAIFYEFYGMAKEAFNTECQRIVDNANKGRYGRTTGPFDILRSCHPTLTEVPELTTEELSSEEMYETASNLLTMSSHYYQVSDYFGDIEALYR
jgi:hypothetical protein